MPLEMNEFKRYVKNRRQAPVRLSELVEKRSRKWRFTAIQRVELIQSKWPEAAGEYVAQHVVPVRLVRKTLRLATVDAAWVSEMTYLAGPILERLKELLPGDWVEELKVVPSEPMPKHVPVLDKPLELPPADAEMEKKADALVAGVADPDLAKHIKRAIVARLRREKAKE